MGRIGLSEILLIAVVFILLFGAKKLPEIAQSLGKALKEFKKASRDVQEDVKDAVKDERKSS